MNYNLDSSMGVKHAIFALLSLVILGLLGFAWYQNEFPEWKKYQREYYKLLAAKTGDKKQLNAPLKVKQVWNQELNRIDRCTTCHLGIDKPNFQDAPQPFKTHPMLSGFVGKHPFEKFGCTVCHDGDGQAVKVEWTHGHVEHLNEPLLTGVYVETSCTRCHLELFSEDVEFPQAPKIMEGKRLVRELGCGACHTINQFGAVGTMAPDISGFGSKKELAFMLLHEFTFKYLKGEHSKRNWEWEHFKDPQKIMPGNPEQNLPPTIMPNWGLSDDEATALTVLVLSLRDYKVENIPMKYIPKLKNHEGFIQYR